MSAAPLLDARAPFVLDTRELGRRPGSMRHVRRTVDAPAGWALELVRVPAGAPVVLDLRMESVVDGVLVSGGVHVPVDAECARCLDQVHAEIDVDVQELFAYEPADAGDEQPLLVGDLLDLEPLVRDAVVLGLPVNPVCSDDCEGLCATCGARLADIDDNHSHDETDPRWDALAQLAGSTTTPPTDETTES
jgi:uncharacterized protein